MGPLHDRYRAVRGFTEELVRPLSAEDAALQSMPDASPAKWHLAHTTWFFETIVLAAAGEAPFDPAYGYLFNSYYEAIGPRHARPRRGMLSRPSLAEVRAYRSNVDERIGRLFDRIARGEHRALVPLVELGLHHEQQHQELIVTDIKHALSENPLAPAYRSKASWGARTPRAARPVRFLSRDERIVGIGHSSDARLVGGDPQTAARGFAFDNEGPRHKVLVHAHAIADRVVTNGEVLEFIADGGYRRAELWLSDGWAAVQTHGWQAPLYWQRRDDQFASFTLDGLRAVEPAEPAVHLSYYEADALARWAGARLPTEAEWESFASHEPVRGNLAESGRLHPAPADEGHQLFGDVWEWTASAYLPYPGFRPWDGALGEYNGKFMSGQMVLRGGSCATPESHLRATYRNFFPPGARWQFAGVRLARDD